MIERRRHPRNPARQRAFLVLERETPPIPCTIRETSPFGTLVECALEDGFPDIFHLLVGGTELLKCRLVRQGVGEAGVEYVR